MLKRDINFTIVCAEISLVTVKLPCYFISEICLFYLDIRTFLFVMTFDEAQYACRPLFASSLLGIVRTLLEQTRQDEMQILGCSILVDFINSQVRNGYESNKFNINFDIFY